MKKHPGIFKFFLGGFVAALLMLNLTHCPVENTSEPTENKKAEETDELKTFSNEVINAFQEGDISAVTGLMYPEHDELYTEGLEDNTEKMAAFAEALKERKIIASEELYAEYEITIEGETYTIAYGQSGDGIWKLLRF